jgi:O-antigen ligase
VTNRYSVLGLLAAGASFVAGSAFADVSPNSIVGAGNLADVLFKKTPYELWLTCLIIAFGLIVMGLYIYSIRGIADKRPEDVSRALIVITVVTSSLLLITAGYSNEQIAPAFGLFGTIIGYMLGRMSPARFGEKQDPTSPEDKGDDGR